MLSRFAVARPFGSMHKLVNWGSSAGGNFLKFFYFYIGACVFLMTAQGRRSYKQSTLA
jgi:hypothetical protein